MTPIAFLRRLALLIPKPGQNMLRYHGQFAPNAKHREQLATLVPSPAEGHDEKTVDLADANKPADTSSLTTSANPYRIRWAQLLRRVFEIDALRCAKCGGPMVLLALLTDPAVVHKILDHIGQLTHTSRENRLPGPGQQVIVFEPEALELDQDMTSSPTHGVTPRAPPDVQWVCSPN